MIRFVIKNLWARRRSCGWLFAELIIITIVAWVVVDPVAVGIYDWSRPLGYDRDRLVAIEISLFDPASSEYSEAESDSESMNRHYHDILRQIREIPEVESAVPMRSWYGPEMLGTNYTQVLGTDTIAMVEIDITPYEKYFSTLGLSTPEGMPTPEALDTMTMSERDYVITEEIARRLFGDENPLGKTFQPVWAENGESYRVVGVVKDFRFKNYQNNTLYGLKWNNAALPPNIYKYARGFKVIARVRPGVDPSDLASDHRLVDGIKSGNFYCSSSITLDDAAVKLNKRVGFTDDMFLSGAVLVFFLACLLLGVIGIFWLQTRARSEEAGVLKSFGATPGFIVRSMVGESWILTFAAWLCGCLIYLQYAVAEGFDNSSRRIFHDFAMPIDWVSDFTAHFGIISGIVLLLLLVVVTIGVLIPAVKISRVNPVDALRDE